MIIRFTTRTGALTMLGESAITLLKLGGHSGSVPGAVLAADLPAFLARLGAELDRHGSEPSPPAPPEPPEERERDVDERDDREAPPPVTLRMRAVPFLDMLKSAIEQRSDLMWERG